MGRRVGTREGDGAGAKEGAADPVMTNEDGSLLGTEERFRVGPLEGLHDRSTVGRALGRLDGQPEGAPLGSLEGTALGSEDGCPVD